MAVLNASSVSGTSSFSKVSGSGVTSISLINVSLSNAVSLSISASGLISVSGVASQNDMNNLYTTVVTPNCTTADDTCRSALKIFFNVLYIYPPFIYGVICIILLILYLI
uniref:Uncharacterized protein n=1 Tax=viral metagenome TaxID=1070528 RepID=A0A6C0CQI5_9ZZZZ